ncbi:MAG: hypothetical protein LBL33_08200 [Tannerella sp.]|jgi:ribosomal-protein-alanine N-acetyltransferase|nr:hypothetical protein [Tannerella sp.]
MMDIFPVLATRRLNLIKIRQCHLNDLYQLFSDKKVTRFYNLLPLENEQNAQKLPDWFRSRFNEGMGIHWGFS